MSENEYPIYRFRKIKYKPAKKEENPVNEYEFTYDIITGRMADGKEIKQAFTLKCNEEPLESFKTTLQALKPYIIELCEQDKEKSPRLMVRTVNISYKAHENGSGVLGVVMTGVCRYKKSPGALVLNTPYKQESYLKTEDGEKKKNKAADSTLLLSEDCLSVLYELFEEAERYVRGERLHIMIDYKEQEKIDKEENLKAYKEDKKKDKTAKGVDAGGNIIDLNGGK